MEANVSAKGFHIFESDINHNMETDRMAQLEQTLGKLTLENEILKKGSLLSIHHSDQGVQYASNAYVERLMKHGVTISMASAGCPEENGYAERLMRTIKEEHVSLTEYENFADAKGRIAHFIEDVYQFKRIHSSLGFLTPSEFEAQCPKDNIN